MPKARNSKHVRPAVNAEWICDASSLDRILSAVGPRLRDKANTDQLIDDLYLARSHLLTFNVLDSDEGAKQRKDLFSAVADSAARLKDLLLNQAADYYVARSIQVSAFSTFSDFDAFLMALNKVIETSRALVEQNNDGGLRRLERSPREWFAAEMLPRVYERNFGRQCGVSRRDETKQDAHAAGGPCIRFISAVMREIGLPMSHETIARALKDARIGRPRRKRRPTTLPGPQVW